MAAIARDESGMFLGASAVVIQGANNPETLEVAACREGMALASDLYLQRVKLASDCANVIRSIRDGEMLGAYGQVVREMKASLRDFDIFDFVHEGRRSNGDAHDLARGSMYSSLGRHVRLQDPPDGVGVNILS